MDENWPSDNENENGWDYGQEEIPSENNQLFSPNELFGVKNLQLVYSKDNKFVFFTVEDVLNTMIKNKVDQTSDTLCLENDQVMAILRYFNWN